MATSGKSVGATTFEKAKYFDQTVRSHFNCGTDTLRQIIQKQLDEKNVTLKSYLSQNSGKLQRGLKQLQYQVNNDPQLSAMDLSLLTMLLINLFTLSKNDIKKVTRLRKIRNILAHAVKAELDDKTLFVESSNLILDLSKTVSKEHSDQMILELKELEQRELVFTCSNLERIIMNNEELLVKLVKAEDSEITAPQDDAMWIKFGLTKWVKQLSRAIDTSLLMQYLKGDGVINDCMKRTIELEYNNEDQMQRLVLHMMNETKENLLKLCQYLQVMCPPIAALVTNKTNDGVDIDDLLMKERESRIKKILTESFHQELSKKVPTEDIHIHVENILRLPLEFSEIKDFMNSIFPKSFNSNDCSFQGVWWNETQMENVAQTIIEDNISKLSCEKFAEYLGKELRSIRSDLEEKVKNAILSESISAPIFADMTADEIKSNLSDYLQPIKYGIGIEKSLLKVQKRIANQQEYVDSEGEMVLRPFDSPIGKLKYHKNGIVRPSQGNFLVPGHAFIFTESSVKYTSAFIAKEVVKFAAACVNCRKNGTIHFGIKDLGSNRGKIIGIVNENTCKQLILNREITRSIEVCFPDEFVANILSCVRPVQLIPLEDDEVIIEIDVVPYSFLLCKSLVSISFPPKGNQMNKYFIFKAYPVSEVLTIEPSRVNDENKQCSSDLHLREILEKERFAHETTSTKLRQTLNKFLTNGMKYVTDGFVPVIVSGSISGCDEENEIRSQLDVENAFTSCKVVFDFDVSVDLRKKIENEKISFQVKTAEDLMTKGKESDIGIGPTWIYCNGNAELGKEQFNVQDWVTRRFSGIKDALEQTRRSIPIGRALIIFLVYQDSMDSQRDSVLQIIAREAFMSTFRNECIVISHKEDVVKNLKMKLSSCFDRDELHKYFHTGLTWSEISLVMKSVFHVNPDVVCKLPCSRGHFVEMTSKEKDDLHLTDIEILSGDQCEPEDEDMNEKDRKTNRTEEQTKFYKGNPVSWWNFYFKDQVGERDDFDIHIKEIKEKVSPNNKGESLVELHKISHHPGAGGSTLGRHLLWHFSQFKKTPEKAYRCCVVTEITEVTVEQIEKFRGFKEDHAHEIKPFLVLLDNQSEDNVVLFRNELNVLAYKTGSPGKLFCVVIIVSRESVSVKSTKGHRILTHGLSKKERHWFESKYEALEKIGDVNVKTLLAFNVMRHSFRPAYIKETTEKIMADVSKNEREVLKCLSLVNTFDNDHPVPENVFDALMEEELLIRSLIGRPFGIAHTIKEREKLNLRKNCTWYGQVSDAMALLITRRGDVDFCKTGISIISQPLAKAVLDYVSATYALQLHDMVKYVVDLTKKHTEETNPMSKRFVKIVCSLFKTRQKIVDSENFETKLKFSDLVLELGGLLTGNVSEEGNQYVLNAMQHCFDMTEDAMVGQQLARFNIHIKDFEAAEVAIKKSISIRPNNSYLLDTYGQIFKSQMEFKFDKASENGSKISDTEASEIIELAFKAIDKFKEGQEIAINQDNEKGTNMSGFHMEVKTALFLLEKFSEFSCFEDQFTTFLHFLNDKDYAIKKSPYVNLLHLCPLLEGIRKGHPSQEHVETSLRRVEERDYQVKGLYTVYAGNESLLLDIRDRFERFYGNGTSQYKFKYGIGLKPLMNAKQYDKEAFIARVDEAISNLKKVSLKEADERDLLVYLGGKLISLSDQPTTNRDECTEKQYTLLLSFSTALVDIQRNRPKSKRLYLETFLYHAILHWPLKARIELASGPTRPCSPKTYEELLKAWEETYNTNHQLRTAEQISKHRPKNFFALGKGTPGNDIVDLEAIHRELTEKKLKENRIRRSVYRDDFWKDSLVEERLERLSGKVNGSGLMIEHTIPQGSHTFRINTYYPCTQFSNRSVTFVLGFTWKGPTAFDVEEEGKTRPKNSKECENIPIMEITEASDNSFENETSKQENKAMIQVSDNPNQPVNESYNVGALSSHEEPLISVEKLDDDIAMVIQKDNAHVIGAEAAGTEKAAEPVDGQAIEKNTSGKSRRKKNKRQKKRTQTVNKI